MEKQYTYVWEFIVAADSRMEFEQHYGANGTWVQLFRRVPGFIETLFLADRARPERYLTVDRWQSEEAYLKFHSLFASEYEKLDAQCAKYTSAEYFIGAFRE